MPASTTQPEANTPGPRDVDRSLDHSGRSQGAGARAKHTRGKWPTVPPRKPATHIHNSHYTQWGRVRVSGKRKWGRVKVSEKRDGVGLGYQEKGDGVGLGFEEKGDGVGLGFQKKEMG